MMPSSMAATITLGNWGTLMDKKIFGHFDNTEEPLAFYDNYIVKQPRPLIRRSIGRICGRRPLLYSGGTPHFRFKLRKKIFVYAYIRKNGCSAIKQFLLNYYNLKSRNASDLHFLQQHFNVTFTEEIYRAISFLILRDPLRRTCSLFRNKLIQSSYSKDIEYNINDTYRLDISSLTFRDFVYKYLQKAKSSDHLQSIDRHAMPQANHLWPIFYTHVFLVDNIFFAMKEITNSEIAEHYFKSKHNASSAKFFHDRCSDWSLPRLKNIYLNEERLPSDQSLLDNEIMEQLYEIYAVDVDLIERAGVQQPLPHAVA